MQAAFAHRTAGDAAAPDLIGPVDPQPAQQTGMAPGRETVWKFSWSGGVNFTASGWLCHRSDTAGQTVEQDQNRDTGNGEYWCSNKSGFGDPSGKKSGY
jgi:hypothetical protein